MNLTCKGGSQIRLYIALIIVLIISIAPGDTSAQTDELVSSQAANVEATFGRLPLQFEANQGQVEAGQVRYIAPGSATGCFLPPPG